MASEIRWASAVPSSPSGRSSTRMANSSPPKRATVSLGRTAERSRAATSTSSSSPALCPSVSLTSLNPSRSRKYTAIGGDESARRASACWSRSLNRARLGRSVSESVKAWWVSCRSRLMRSVTSRVFSTRPPTAGFASRLVSVTSIWHSRPLACRQVLWTVCTRSASLATLRRTAARSAADAGAMKSVSGRPTIASASYAEQGLARPALVEDGAGAVDAR